MKVTVCELANNPSDFVKDWDGLVQHVKLEFSDLSVAAKAKRTYPRYVLD